MTGLMCVEKHQHPPHFLADDVLCHKPSHPCIYQPDVLYHKNGDSDVLCHKINLV